MKVTAGRTDSAIDLDGRLDDAAWADAPVAGGFLQRDPNEGDRATEATDLRILHDGSTLYVAARLHDSEPERIVRQLSRRDQIAAADVFTLYLDTHHDHLTGYLFELSAAGVQRDAVLYDDLYIDETWDAVWRSAVSVDDGGWTLEMAIPLSQLRFSSASVDVWGINARRSVHRKNEESWLELVRKNENGLASRMAHLGGVAGARPGSRLQLLPYISTRAEYVAPDGDGDPFNDGSRGFAGAGLDLEYGLSSNMSLVAAINPDFGQVEVDPAVVNLSAFETFFEEQRPFFTEGAQTFGNFARSGAADYQAFFYPEPLLFYSRRIGREPQGRPAADFVDATASTTILGAVKLTGRTRDGWTVGVLDALTGRESARTSTGGAESRVPVEPLTNYFVGRVQRELGRRGAIGFIGTASNRDLESPELVGRLTDQAYVAGFDGHVFLDARRDWVVFGGLSGSAVSGSREAIERLQRSEQRYYQRPDAPHVSLDPDATSLSGWSGRLGLNKNSGDVTVNAGVWGVSPGFEPNDLGFARQTDRGGAHGMILFRKTTPDGFTRERELWVSKWWTFNYGGESQGDGILTQANALLRNYMEVELRLGRSWATLDDKLTRGGPTTIRPGIRSLDLEIQTDRRRRLSVELEGSLRDRDFGAWSRRIGLEIDFRPWDALTLSINPSWLRSHTIAQYLDTVPDPTAVATSGSRYVFGELDRDEVSMPLRLNLALSPKLSLQVYSQPLVSVGAYASIRELAAPRTYDFPVYGTDRGTIERDGVGGFVIDPDGPEGPAASFGLADRAFNFKSLRVNAVLRWEPRPGSALFAVWQQNRQGRAHPGDFSLGRDFDDLLGAPSDDVFLIKLAWWIGT